VSFFQDLACTAWTLDRDFAQVKMNINLPGNLVPLLHTHLIPRYYDEPAPGGNPLDKGLSTVTLTSGEHRERIRQTQATL
jgi:diadenosine tetraphosphate (Ap4A) HIT family hydrolase